MAILLILFLQVGNGVIFTSHDADAQRQQLQQQRIQQLHQTQLLRRQQEQQQRGDAQKALSQGLLLPQEQNPERATSLTQLEHPGQQAHLLCVSSGTSSQPTPGQVRGIWVGSGCA